MRALQRVERLFLQRRSTQNDARPSEAGATSAFVGFVRMATGAAASGVVGVLQSVWGAGAMTWAMAGFALFRS
jgi:hypothetical protein